MAPSALARRRLVITSGPTREYLDDVRFLSNASTGRMGQALARLAARRGARVTLVQGPCALPRLPGIKTIDVVSTADLLAATRAAAAGADALIFAAAPSDFRPKTRRQGKPGREVSGAFALDLVATPDVAASLGRTKGARIHVGFALEVAGGEVRARAKMKRKRFDAIVLNSTANFGGGGGDAHWIRAGDPALALPTSSKARLARAILDHLERLLAGA
ncbi:MAG: phosphopantothenoylcysteine decarboxylase [Planctomycetota bacterium]|nr:phosphopantothenoylcysteine decarboxylase [Planctomycetota bacterium]